MKEGRFWTKEKDGYVRCTLCPHHCLIAQGKTGICRVRENQGGILYAPTYGKIVSLAFDPIEKKPLYHFYPGREILSIGSVGCNLRCTFCQNWQISQVGFRDVSLQGVTPQQLVELALREQSIGIAYTYNEPFIFWEFVYDTASLAHEKQLKNVLVTNGYVESAPLVELLPLIDAMNIDLKAMEESFYREQCGGSLSPVLATIESAFRWGVHVEITHLVVSGFNDRLELIDSLVNWVSGLSPLIPVHFSRYFPHYRMNNPPTSLAFLEEAFRAAKRKLHFVYLGNVWDETKSSTVCPLCGKTVVIRRGYAVEVVGLEGNRCRFCQAELPFAN